MSSDAISKLSQRLSAINKLIDEKDKCWLELTKYNPNNQEIIDLIVYD
jgi:hypothetical protein